MRRDIRGRATWREVAPDGGNPTGFDEYYTYDGLDRLEKAERGTLAGSPYSSISSHTRRQDFGLEALGNWKEFKDDAGDGSTWDLDQDRTHNAVNETTGITGGSWIVPGYDAAGNMTSGPKPTDPTVRQHYKWDAWNRLVAVYADNNGEPGNLIAEYRYDAFNRRIAKIVPNGENWDRTDYYYTPAGQVVEERFAANQEDKETLAVPRKFQYVWDIRYIHAAVLRDEDTDADNDCTDSGGSERLYYTQDANFNVTALVETDGDIAERYVYDPYGKRTIYDDDWSDEVTWANSKKNEILFTGHRLDTETGLYYGGWRYYHPTLGLWISRELGGYLDGMSLYAYCRSMPQNLVDTDGQRSIAIDPELDNPHYIEDQERKEQREPVPPGYVGPPGLLESAVKALASVLPLESICDTAMDASMPVARLAYQHACDHSQKGQGELWGVDLSLNAEAYLPLVKGVGPGGGLGFGLQLNVLCDPCKY